MVSSTIYPYQLKVEVNTEYGWVTYFQLKLFLQLKCVTLPLRIVPRTRRASRSSGGRLRSWDLRGTSGDDGPRAAVCFKKPLVICYAVEDCWSHGPVEIVDLCWFTVLFVVGGSFPQSVCLPEATPYESQRIWTSPWDWRCGMFFFNYGKGWIGDSTSRIAWNDMNRQQPQCNRDSTSKKMRCWRIRWPQTSTKHIPSGYVEIAIEHGP